MVINDGVDDGLAADVEDTNDITTQVYDVVINDRTTSDIVINDNSNRTSDEDKLESDLTKSFGNDIHKLLAAQAHAIEVFNMIEDLEAEMMVKELTYFMLKSCFTSVLVLMDFNLMFMHFSSLWGANDLFSMKIMNQPIRADFATIG